MSQRTERRSPSATRIAQDVNQLDPIWTQTLARGYLAMLQIVQRVSEEECWDWSACDPERAHAGALLPCPPCRAVHFLETQKL